MVVAKQMDVRANIKKYFDIAYNGEPVVVPRKDNKNVMIISEELYRKLTARNRLSAYASKLGQVTEENAGKEEKVPDVLTFNLEKLEKIANLPDGWNGNGAPAFPEELIEKVRNILNALDIQPEIFPTALSTIQLEFDNSRRDHMEIEIGLQDRAEAFFTIYDGTEKTEEIDADPASINESVRAFYG